MHSFSKIILPIFLIFAPVCILAQAAGAGVEVDLLQTGKGVESPTEYQAGNCDKTTVNEFVPYSAAFTRQDQLTGFQIPPGAVPTKYKYAGIGPVKVQPLEIYRLRFSPIKEGEGGAGEELILSVTYLRNARPILFNHLYTHHLLPGIVPTLEVGLCAPPEADAMIVWIGWKGAEPMPPARKFLLTELRLVPDGPLIGNAAGNFFQNKNLLSVSDFDDLPLGPLADPAARGIFNCKNPKISATGSPSLHIVKTAADSPFPYFSAQPVSLFNCGVEFSCKVKGKGRVHPMIWWRLRGESWSYHAGQQEVELTDQWQTLRIWVPCLNPAQVSAAGSVAITSQEADLYIDDVCLRVQQPAERAPLKTNPTNQPINPTN